MNSKELDIFPSMPKEVNGKLRQRKWKVCLKKGGQDKPLSN